MKKSNISNPTSFILICFKIKQKIINYVEKKINSGNLIYRGTQKSLEIWNTWPKIPNQLIEKIRTKSPLKDHYCCNNSRCNNSLLFTNFLNENGWMWVYLVKGGVTHLHDQGVFSIQIVVRACKLVLAEI